MSKLSQMSGFTKSILLLIIGAIITASGTGVFQFVNMCFETKNRVILMQKEQDEGLARDISDLAKDIEGLSKRMDDQAEILKEIAWEYRINKELKKLGVIPDPLNTAFINSPPQPPIGTPTPQPSPTPLVSPSVTPAPSFGEIISAITQPKISEEEKVRILKDSNEWAKNFDVRQMSY